MKWDQEKYSIAWWQKKLLEDGLPSGQWFAFEQNRVSFYGTCRFFTKNAMNDCIKDNEGRLSLSSFAEVTSIEFERLIIDEGMHCATFIENYITDSQFLKILANS